MLTIVSLSLSIFQVSFVQQNLVRITLLCTLSATVNDVMENKRAVKRTGSHHENHSTPPRIMYAVRETRRLLPCYSRIEILVGLGFPLLSPEFNWLPCFNACNLRTCKERTILPRRKNHSVAKRLTIGYRCVSTATNHTLSSR